MLNECASSLRVFGMKETASDTWHCGSDAAFLPTVAEQIGL
jgi:hypothetical protein